MLRLKGDLAGPASFALPALCMLLVISPWARKDFVDHSVTNQSSILRFIEDNWQTGQVGDDSFDAKSNSLLPMFDFSQSGDARVLFLDPATGLRVDDGNDNSQ